MQWHITNPKSIYKLYVENQQMQKWKNKPKNYSLAFCSLESHCVMPEGSYLICCCWAMVLGFCVRAEVGQHKGGAGGRGRAGWGSPRDTGQGKSARILRVIYIEGSPALRRQRQMTWLSTHKTTGQEMEPRSVMAVSAEIKPQSK